MLYNMYVTCACVMCVQYVTYVCDMWCVCVCVCAYVILKALEDKHSPLESMPSTQWK